jgi:YHS domain-containing protein
MKTVLSVFAALALSVSAFAANLVNVDRNVGIALEGYDPVSFFASGQPTKGDPSIRASHNGATYLFASAESKASFEKSPGNYEPQFGGYCAYGVELGVLLPVDVSTWVIRDGKLYLNYSKPVAGLFAKDTEASIKKARANWPKLSAENSK